MPGDKDLIGMSAKMERLGISSSPGASYDGSHSPPISTSHGHISSDIQARIMAFQQKRQTAVVPKDSVNKPLPSLPKSRSRPVSQSDILKSGLLSSPSLDTASTETTDSEPEFQKAPQSIIGAGPMSPKATELTKKPSLSQRRGMKLNINDASSPRVGSESVNSAGELARRLSERKNRTGLKLNFNGNPSSPGSNEVLSFDSKESQGPAPAGLFANYSNFVDIKSGSLNFTGKASLNSKGVNFSSGTSFHISLEEFQPIEELGRGNYGTVSKVLHKPTGVLMAMKEVRLELEENKFAQILMELEVLHKCDSPYIVDFYGAFFVEGAVYMCMEYMDGGSLDKIYGNGILDEDCLAYITECVIRGLKVLKDTHNIIHRDVKPTNILVNSLGKVKLCDFGVSGNLVASLAKTNIGCQSYMAPERIKTMNPDDATYSVQSDVWSLGLTILEVAKGGYPYPPETFDNIFSQLSAIVDGEPPKLSDQHFSKNAQMFVKACLTKNPDARPPYDVLLQFPWLKEHKGNETLMSSIVKASLAEGSPPRKNVAKAPVADDTLGEPKVPGRESVKSLLRSKVNAPALHRGGLPNQRVRR